MFYRPLLKTVLSLALCWSISLNAALQDHFKKAMDKTQITKMRNIDFIYLINLDERPCKYRETLSQLAPFGIYPYRFSAVNGWKIGPDEIQDLGVVCKRKLKKPLMGTRYDPNLWKEPTHEWIQPNGHAYFCHCMSLGAIGIALSHLSILQDAYDSGYKTIWVIEDDIEVLQNPQHLSYLISHLDEKVGKKNWDILYTDRDTKNRLGQYEPFEFFARRPNYTPKDKARAKQKKKICSHFRKIGGRFGTYSMIIRRSGMKKLLDFFKKKNLFLPIDMDLCMANDIHLYTVLEDVVSTLPLASSDNGGPNYK